MEFVDGFGANLHRNFDRPIHDSIQRNVADPNSELWYRAIRRWLNRSVDDFGGCQQEHELLDGGDDGGGDDGANDDDDVHCSIDDDAVERRDYFRSNVYEDGRDSSSNLRSGFDAWWLMMMTPRMEEWIDDHPSEVRVKLLSIRDKKCRFQQLESSCQQ